MIELDRLTIDDLRPSVGTPYRLDLGEHGTLDLTLLTVEGYGDPPVGGGSGPARRQPFSIELRGPLEPQLAQATYRLDHAELGPLAAFLVPIARDPEGMRYQAIFA
ncbi:MAG: hypothetical protein ITG02_09640 [Patulibacter sp.]|nr:hypothetical protein [Patulibacter sp.]